MKKGELIELTIDRLKFPDRAVGSVMENGTEKKVQVRQALPGQRCQVMITRKRGGKIEGRVIKVLRPAENEVAAACSIFGQCGGCRFLNLPYKDQLRLKEDHVKSLLEAAEIHPKEWLPIIPSPEVFGYRNKMEYSFGDDEPGGPLKCGLHQQNSFYNILSTDQCRIVDQDFSVIRSAVQHYFDQMGESYFHKGRHIGFLRHLVIRKGKVTGDILVNLVTTSDHALEDQSFVALLRALSLEGHIVGILHTINDGVADVVQGAPRVLFGQNSIHDRVLGLNFEITAFSFFQTNTLGAERLYDTVRSFVQSAVDSESKPTIFDLYCGTGTIAQVMSPIAEKVIGVELVAEAVAAAERNAAQNGLMNCTFIAGDVLKIVDTLGEKPEVIVLDPPREGIHPKAIFKIIDFAPDIFVYVACKPESLARDLPFFVHAGYEVQKVRCVDMFPHTGHVETVVLMSRANEYREK